jgi:hypothetical protein
VDDQRERYRRGGLSAGRGRGHVSEVRGGSGEGMSRVESTEREDYDDRNAGVGKCGRRASGAEV